MRFTYQSYRKFLNLLREQDYSFRSYRDYETAPRCVILRHDVDQSLSQAVKLAELEADYQIPGIVNSYGKTFFQDFKYLSDSRRRWRERYRQMAENMTDIESIVAKEDVL